GFLACRDQRHHTIPRDRTRALFQQVAVDANPLAANDAALRQLLEPALHAHVIVVEPIGQFTIVGQRLALGDATLDLGQYLGHALFPGDAVALVATLPFRMGLDDLSDLARGQQDVAPDLGDRNLGFGPEVLDAALAGGFNVALAGLGSTETYRDTRQDRYAHQ